MARVTHTNPCATLRTLCRLRGHYSIRFAGLGTDTRAKYTVRRYVAARDSGAVSDARGGCPRCRVPLAADVAESAEIHPCADRSRSLVDSVAYSGFCRTHPAGKRAAHGGFFAEEKDARRTEHAARLTRSRPYMQRPAPRAPGGLLL